MVGGAGFGKSTLAARVATSRRSAWYTLDTGDRHLGALTSGIVAALRVALPDLPADLAGPIEGSIEATDEVGILGRANAAAALLSDAIEGVLEGPLLLVLDDVHVLSGAPVAWRLVEALVRLAPADLRILITSRTELPFSVERLRGQGQVMDLGGSTLAFTEHEIASLVGILLVDEVPEPADPPPLQPVFPSTTKCSRTTAQAATRMAFCDMGRMLRGRRSLLWPKNEGQSD